MNKNNHNFINFASAEQPEKHTHSRTWCVWQLVWLLDPLAFGPKVLLIALRRPPIKSKPTALSWDLMTYPLPHGQLPSSQCFLLASLCFPENKYYIENICPNEHLCVKDIHFSHLLYICHLSEWR